jgi:Fur family ferric uptake transcriptional regulator
VTERPTRQGAAVRTALAAAGGFSSAQAVHAAMREAGESVALATVYRRLQSLASSGEADTLITADGETLYRLCGADTHHHHLVCRSCGLTVEVGGTAVERWVEQVAAEHGFSDTGHTVEVLGVCADCASPLG